MNISSGKPVVDYCYYLSW